MFRAIIRGALKMCDLSCLATPTTSEPLDNSHDAKALAGDWKAVGNDIKTVIYRHNKVNPVGSQCQKTTVSR